MNWETFFKDFVSGIIMIAGWELGKWMSRRSK